MKIIYAKVINCYQKIFYKPNELYDLCGNCQYYDEFGCWQPDCLRQHKFKNKSPKDMKLEMGLPWIPIDR